MSLSATTIRLWITTSLPYVSAAAIAIGALGPYVPELAGFGVSPQWVQIAGKIVAVAGAIGAWLSNPPPIVKRLLPWLFPVTPAMHLAAMATERMVYPDEPTVKVMPPLKPSEIPTIPPPPNKGAQ
jgi:hypothetical protein